MTRQEALQEALSVWRKSERELDRLWGMYWTSEGGVGADHPRTTQFRARVEAQATVTADAFSRAVKEAK